MLGNCQGGCGMIDQVSITVSQRLRKGTRKGELVNLFLIAVRLVFFSFLPLGQRKGGDVHGRKSFFGAKLHMCLLVSDSFSASLFRVKNLKHTS